MSRHSRRGVTMMKLIMALLLCGASFANGQSELRLKDDAPPPVKAVFDKLLAKRDQIRADADQQAEDAVKELALMRQAVIVPSLKPNESPMRGKSQWGVRSAQEKQALIRGGEKDVEASKKRLAEVNQASYLPDIADICTPLAADRITVEANPAWKDDRVAAEVKADQIKTSLTDGWVGRSIKHGKVLRVDPDGCWVDVYVDVPVHIKAREGDFQAREFNPWTTAIAPGAEIVWERSLRLKVETVFVYGSYPSARTGTETDFPGPLLAETEKGHLTLKPLALSDWLVP